jgi:hypothetical protein
MNVDVVFSMPNGEYSKLKSEAQMLFTKKKASRSKEFTQEKHSKHDASSVCA